MGFSVIPTNIGGVSINSALSPLAALYAAATNKIDNLIFPADLGSNPAMGHAIVFQAYDRTSKLQQDVQSLVGATSAVVDNAINAGTVEDATQNLVTGLFNADFGSKVLKVGGDLIKAPSYASTRSPGSPLATISLFMPENINVNYSSTYGEVSMTQALGMAGIVGSAISEINKANLKETATPYGIYGVGKIIEKIAPKLGGTAEAGLMAAQALGVVENPQMQLLYRGVNLREFQLEFVLTPKSAAEAKVVKDICDSFTFFSLPGLAGGQTGDAGQFLTPPQLFSVQFRFLGQNSLVGNISNVISSALTNSGLGFFTNDSIVSSGTAAKFFTVNDCVLENVAIDYTPNGLATYNDGYPVQTRLTLSFKETQMITKNHFKNSKIAENYQRVQNTNALGDWNDSTGALE